MLPTDDARISPTAHYTGTVFRRHGLSHDALRTAAGTFFYSALRPVNLVYGAVGGPTLEHLLLARHAAIDAQLDAAIASGQVGQVLEIASGLSGRGLRFSRRWAHTGLVYVEGDLAGMAARKRRAFDEHSLRGERHRVVTLDAFAEVGTHSLNEVAATWLHPRVGTAIVTEGLVNYFEPRMVKGLWSRFAQTLSRFPFGVYLSDIHLGGSTFAYRFARIFARALEVFARGRIHMHFHSEAECTGALRDAGFDDVAVEPPSALGAPALRRAAGDAVVRVIRARTGSPLSLRGDVC